MTKWMHLKGVLLNVTWLFWSDPDTHNYSCRENMFVVKNYAGLLRQSPIKSGRFVLSLIRRQITTANTDKKKKKTNVPECCQGS
jgi:hypothetical protein